MTDMNINVLNINRGYVMSSPSMTLPTPLHSSTPSRSVINTISSSISDTTHGPNLSPPSYDVVLKTAVTHEGILSFEIFLNLFYFLNFQKY